MKNWMLVCCCERDIETPKFFDTKEEAVKAMCADVADVLGMPVDEVMEVRANGDIVRDTEPGKINDYAWIADDYAWCDRHVPCDWKIFNLMPDDVHSA
jgi:hypothetical protein